MIEYLRGRKNKMKVIDDWFGTHETMTKEEYNFLNDINNQLKDKDKKIEELENKPTTLRPIRTFKLKTALIEVLKENPEGMTINDIVKHFDDETVRASLYNYLSKYIKEGLVDKSSTRPIIYYFKENGDPVSAELFKNSTGIKVSKMG